METEISRSVRNLAPVHYSLKVRPFSSVSEIAKYKSGVFEAGGYHWKLLFYPNGDKKNSGKDHISLYLKIVGIETLPVDWELFVKFQFFVHNQILDNYLVIQDDANSGVRHFNSMKKSWGFAKLLPLATFKDSSNGYLVVRDSCLFGAEVFVLKKSGKSESVSRVKAPSISNPTFTWEIEKYLKLYPRGKGGYEGKYLALYLLTSDWKSQGAGMHAEYNLRVVDQVNGKHNEHKSSYCFGASCKITGHGSSVFMALEDLHELSNGFIVKDCVTVEVEFLSVTETKYFGDYKLKG